MTPPLPYSPDSFTLEYRPDAHLLIGRWLRPVSLAELKSHYEALLAAALAHQQCRHWLLDIRRRPYSDAAAARWFGEEFSPRLPQLLGRPVAIAYFAMVNQDTASADPDLQQNMEQGELHGGYYHYFNQEREALSWLARQS